MADKQSRESLIVRAIPTSVPSSHRLTWMNQRKYSSCQTAFPSIHFVPNLFRLITFRFTAGISMFVLSDTDADLVPPYFLPTSRVKITAVKLPKLLFLTPPFRPTSKHEPCDWGAWLGPRDPPPPPVSCTRRDNNILSFCKFFGLVDFVTFTYCNRQNSLIYYSTEKNASTGTYASFRCKSKWPIKHSTPFTTNPIF